MRALILVSVLATACGRIGFDDRGVHALGCASDSSASCYLAGYQATWLAAEATCEAEGVGTHLTVIDDPAELAFVQELRSETALDIVWVGVSDRISTGTWLTVTGDPAYLSWAPGNPDLEHCVMITSSGMRDRECDDVYNSVCERDGVDVDRMAF